MAASPRILVTAATGNIGGTILNTLVRASDPVLSRSPIFALVRGQDRVAAFKAAYGDRVQVVFLEDLEDSKAVTATAAQYDIIINSAPGFHPTFALNLLEGLAQRKASTGRDAWLVHTSGTSDFSDQPITGKYVEKAGDREFDDAKEDLYEYHKEREALNNYAQRAVEVAVVGKGLELGIKTVVITSPTTFGTGTGLFSKLSIQVPAYLQLTLLAGHGIVVGEGKAEWDHVHIEDVADLYKIVLVNILEDGAKNVPYGANGILFTANGRHTWKEVAQLAADSAFDAGKISDKLVHAVELDEFTKLLQKLIPFADADFAELAFASNSRGVANVARQLGWKPTRGEKEWKQDFNDTFQMIMAKQQ
ncbi:uncharacterized protein E0L32_001319 [Thyridium curvatum]|uniref:NAD-dependent epimerase/dehydratase domain-containing protein n=1 Tax=Thyridium curvatum TaxID=1093900 RepID=A0A507AKI4_9PEZI|nr:uncharacterized protein E0L32_001319 [Thyridium curvatum]TPX10122.1 hypothetical protein E0L32_001319 [Thyridium curvatum]